MTIDPTRRRWVRAALLIFAPLATACDDNPLLIAPEGSVDLAQPWTVASPAAVGLDGNRLFLAGERAADIERMRSLLVISEGRLAYERYFGGMGPDSLADVRSVTKSVVSTLVGIALAQGHIESLDEPITRYVDAETHGLRPEHARVSIRHLLLMSGGFAWDESGTAAYNDWVTSRDPARYLAGRPLVDEPGGSFVYNSAAVHLLGTLLAEAVGTSMPAFADSELFGPLRIGVREWEILADASPNGGSGLDLRPRDLARIGQLFLQEGWSGNRPLVSARWIAEATTRHWFDLGSAGPIDPLAYGYLWWLDPDNGAYFAWGYGGQFVYVAPQDDLVVVATTEWRGVSEDVGSAALSRAILSLIVDDVLDAAR